ncbi:hypothetical protein [Streptomyces sp. NPDC020681]|uniref:hypothetical protein n=1 Tax=Streptomyces sp. NPDC020681 TaxID=3365083 RepID=UPI0037B73C55
MTLTRGARITGAALCAALALIVGGWIVRDLGTVDHPLDLWRFWAGAGPGIGLGPGLSPPTTLLEDLLLFAVYVTVSIAALRSSVASAALVAAGVITLALRLPGLWVLSSTWMGIAATDELRARALYATFASLALGVGLLITAVAGRSGRPGQAGRTTATRPRGGVRALAFVLLVVSAGVLAAWEIHTAVEYRGTDYLDRFTGSAAVMLPVFGIPPGWLTLVTVVLALVAGFGALVGAVFSRPLGLVAGVFVLGVGGRGLDVAVRNDLIARLGDLPARQQLQVLSWLFELVAGAVLLMALARRGEPDPDPEPEYGYGYPHAGSPPPPSSPPPGW